VTTQAGLWGFASTGVDLFFVLSGYVFAPYFLGKPLDLGSHLIRRFFRLYPLYLFALLLYIALHVPAKTAWDHFWVHLFMGHTLASLAIANFYNPAFWSLPPEVEYYLLLPLLAWAAARCMTGRLGFVWVALLAAAVHMALVAAASPDEKGVTARAIATVHIPGLLVEFMLGTVAYALVRFDVNRRFAPLRLVLGLLVLAGMGFVFSRYVAPVDGLARTVSPWIGGNIGLGAALGYGLLVSGVARSAQVPRSGSTAALQPVFVVMGELSYGVYLLHNAAPQILKRVLPDAAGGAAVLLCSGMTLLMAFAAHRVVEKPMRSYGRRLSQTFARSK
jgi:exopolysaccharide production protein ExoZ